VEAWECGYISSTSVTLPLAAQTLGGGSLPVETLVGAVVGACFGTALLYTAVLLVVKFTLVLCHKRRHRSAFIIDVIDYMIDVIDYIN